MTKSSRILIRRFRTTNNRLPSNTGRYTGVNGEERVCNKCNAKVIRDEFHVILEYTNEKIARLRDMYVPSYYTLRQTHLKYAKLLGKYFKEFVIIFSYQLLVCLDKLMTKCWLFIFCVYLRLIW